MKTYSIAVIGCGRIAGHNCRAIKNTRGLELAAVCDLEIEKANEYQKEFDVPAFFAKSDLAPSGYYWPEECD